MSTSYDEVDTQQRIPLQDIINILQYSFLKRYANLDARHISSLPSDPEMQQTISM
jgi:hypothetical protein